MLLCPLACMHRGLMSPTPRMHCARHAQPPSPMLRRACLTAPALCTVPTLESSACGSPWFVTMGRRVIAVLLCRYMCS